MRAKIQADIYGICLGSAYDYKKIFKVSPLQRKKPLQKESNVKNKRRILSRKPALKYIHTSAAAFRATCLLLFHIMICAAAGRRNGD